MEPFAGSSRTIRIGTTTGGGGGSAGGRGIGVITMFGIVCTIATELLLASYETVAPSARATKPARSIGG